MSAHIGGVRLSKSEGKLGVPTALHPARKPNSGHGASGGSVRACAVLLVLAVYFAFAGAAHAQKRPTPPSSPPRCSATGVTLTASSDTTVVGASNYAAATMGTLTGVSELDGSQTSYSYDPLYRLTSEGRTGSNPESNSYGYDLAGNRTAVDGTHFTFDAGNKLNQTQYDADGNALHDLEGNTFTWDSSSQTASITGTSGTGVENEYDGVGRRIFAHSVGIYNGVDRAFVYDGGTLLGEISLPADGSGQAQVTAAYTWGALGLVSERVTPYGSSTGTSYWYAFGPQGAGECAQRRGPGPGRALTDSTGAVVDRYTYTAYGYTAAGSHPIANPFRFGGQSGYYTDPLTSPDLMLCGERWYRSTECGDPGGFRDSASLGSWLKRDPAGYNGGANLYLYCLDDPVDVIAPTGTKAAVLYRGGCAGGNHPVPPSGGAIDHFGSFVSGFGDFWTTVPFTNICLTRSWREYLGAETLVDTNNGWYTGGQVAGAADSLGIDALNLASAWKAFKAWKAARALRLVTVTSWASEGITPELNPGRWVQLGNATRLNFWKTGLGWYKASVVPLRVWKSGVMDGNFITGDVPASSLQWPKGWDAVRGFFGQRQIKP